MKIFEMYSRNKCTAWVSTTLILVSVLISILAVIQIKITPDSIRYGLISEQILSGNGIRLPMIRLMYDLNVAKDATIPYLEQPPLLPALLALMGGLTSQSYFAAQTLNVICYVALSIFTFLITKRIYNNEGIALLTALLVSLSYPLLRLVNRIATEPLFIALTVLTVYLLIVSRQYHRYRFNRTLFIAGIIASAAIMTRFAGIALIPVLLWEAVISLKNTEIKSKLRSGLLAVSMPVITTSALFMRNYIASGTIRGFDQATPDRSYLSAFTGTIDMMFMQFQLGKRPVIFCAVFMILFVIYILFNAHARRELSKLLRDGLDLALIFIISYTALIFITMAKQQPLFELRYMAPVVPFLYITGIIIIAFVWKMIGLNGFSRLSLAGVILSLGILAFGSFYKTCLNVPDIFNRQVKYDAVLSGCTYNWIINNYGKDTVIATNNPFPVSFFGGYATLRLPHKRINSNFLVPEDMESALSHRMLELRTRVLVIFNGVEERYDGSYITKLFNQREGDNTFNIVHECPDGIIFNLKK